MSSSFMVHFSLHHLLYVDYIRPGPAIRADHVGLGLSGAVLWLVGGTFAPDGKAATPAEAAGACGCEVVPFRAILTCTFRKGRRNSRGLMF